MAAARASTPAWMPMPSSPKWVSPICQRPWADCEARFSSRAKTVPPDPAHSEPPHSSASLTIGRPSSIESMSRGPIVVVPFGWSEKPQFFWTDSSDFQTNFLSGRK
jgi:hypothetical protein